MASFIFQAPLLQKSYFVGETNHLSHHSKISKTRSISVLKVTAKFNLFEIMGGRGLCNGEEGLQQLLNTKMVPQTSDTPDQQDPPPPPTTSTSTSTDFEVDENAFDKELLGLTGGFPGGETGLITFLEKNPPPPKKTSGGSASGAGVELISSKAQPPPLPLLMPGMIAIVKNPNHPFYMYCGIIQRITDGKAGVLFEGGNWDKLITFRLDELERRDKGPPMVNPKSVSLEPLLKSDSS